MIVMKVVRDEVLTAEVVVLNIVTEVERDVDNYELFMFTNQCFQCLKIHQNFLLSSHLHY